MNIFHGHGFGCHFVSIIILVIAGSRGAHGQTNYYTYEFYPPFTNEITITGYTGPGGVVNVPATIDGKTVVAIGGLAFQTNGTVTSIAMSNSVTRIQYSAFAGCSNLTNVLIGTGLLYMDDPFDDCPRLMSINVRAGNPNFSSTNGVLCNADRTWLIRCPAGRTNTYSIPGSIQALDYACFYQCIGLTNIVIPGSVTNIGYKSFGDCTALTGLVIPASVTDIGNYAFSGCSGLKNIIIPNSVTNIGGWGFVWCTGLTNIVLPESMGFIGPYTFQYCASLSEVIIPAGVTNIGSGAFENCTNLSSVTLPYNVVEIEGSAFQNCTALTNITIPSAVQTLGWGVFHSCSNLMGVYFLGSAPTAEDNIFDQSAYVTAYKLPGTSGWPIESTPGESSNWKHRPLTWWQPDILSGDTFGIESNRFAFNMRWVSGMTVVVDACTNISNPIWTPLQTNLFSSGMVLFDDAHWTNYSRRFYRLRSP